MVRIVLFFVVSFCSLSLYAAPSLNIGAAQADYQVGDIVSVDISLTGSPKIHGGGVDISFNPEVFQVQSVSVDGVWSLANRQGVVDNQAGKINEILFANYNGVEGDLGIATIQMKVVGSGSSGIGITESSKNPFTDIAGADVSFDTNNLFSAADQILAEESVGEESTTTQAVAAQTQTDTVQATSTTTASTVQTTAQTTVGGSGFRSGGNNGQVYSKTGANRSSGATVSEGGVTSGRSAEYTNAADGKTYNRSVNSANATRYKSDSKSAENTEQNASQISEDYAYTDNSKVSSNESGAAVDENNESGEATLSVSDSYMKYLPVLGLVIFFLIAFKFLPNKSRTK